jgi:hypothetical protein
MSRPSRQIAGARLLPLLCCLAAAGCSFPPPLSPNDREALDSCRSEADRIYNVQNRYQLSERDSRDSPFSAGTQVPQPSDGLADQYSHDEMVSDCLRHNDAEPAAETPAPKPATP